ncbi:6672_t:CDS:2 [Gigaspora margarita]|uniref:6672_t:CDS:1 n=1 Tax=Gigaspora margarita TaxID=4874 RepID=A0ABN7V725_GIGMA|nr:6672_t:CDS:2 [Gigaspora margarita]
MTDRVHDGSSSEEESSDPIETSGRPYDMKVHLARYCDNTPDDIKIKWRDYLAEGTSKPIARTKSVKQSNITTHYQQITPISDTKANELDQAILKAWVCCGFSFCTIENPFIIDLFKLAIPGYILPSRTTLSSRLLDQETEYLIKLRSYNESQTGQFMATEIKKVLQDIGLQKFAAILLENHTEIISNSNVFGLLQNEEFYSKCCQIASILKPVKELTNILEARNADLAECFIGLTRLATSINRIESRNQWRTLMINNFNRRRGLQQTALNKIYETASLIWYNFRYTEVSCLNLLSEMRLWKRKETPLKWWMSINVHEENDQLQELALFLFSIVPSQAVCERNFSTLKWLFGDKRTQLNLLRIESIAKIRSFYISNTDKELRIYGKDMNDKDLKESLNNSVIIQPTEDLEIDDDHDNYSQQILTDNLNLSQLVDLTLPEFLSTNNSLFESATNRLSSHERAYNLENREYDPVQLAQQMINEENDL